jgi:hypothetical protein
MCKSNSRFQSNHHGFNGAYICEACGKRTRETGHEESGLGLCALCLWRTYAENSVSDNVTDDAIRQAMLGEARSAATVKECELICNRAQALGHS